MARTPSKPSAHTTDPAEQIAFLRQWRKALRLPLNAREALIVDGTQPTADPGVLRHLLSKVDRAAIEQALNRRPLCDDASQRARFLAGAAALTQDAGILIDALEAQQAVAKRTDVARAFSSALQQLDLASLSHARLARLLALIDLVFAPAEQISTAFSLLETASFRAALANASPRLPEQTTRRWLPLAAVHEAMAGGEPARDLLEQGLKVLLGAPPEALDRQPNRIRFGLVTTALNLDAAWPTESPAIDRIVDSLDDREVAWAGLAFNRAAGQVRTGRYKEAVRRLDRILAQHPHDLRATALLGQLSAPRLGSIALVDRQPGALRTGFALSLLRPVLVRTDADLEAVALHRELDLPGIAPLLLSGEADAPWFAVDGGLLVLDAIVVPDRSAALQIALAGVQIAALLTQLGLTIPDLHPGRFVVDTSVNRRWLELADLTGVRRQPEISGAHMRTIAVRFARAALAQTAFVRSPVRPDLRHAVRVDLERFQTEAPSVAALARWLAGL